MAFATLGSLLQNLTAADWVDVACVALTLVSIGLGAYRGISGELPADVGWVLGGLAGWYTYHPASHFYESLPFLEEHHYLAMAAAIVTVALLAWGVAALVRLGLGRLMKLVAKQPLDHILGTVAGLVRAALVLLVATAAVLLLPWYTPRHVLCHESRAGRIFAPPATQLLVSAKALFPKIELHRASDPGEAIIEDARRTIGLRSAWETNNAARPGS